MHSQLYTKRMIYLKLVCMCVCVCVILYRLFFKLSYWIIALGNNIIIDVDVSLHLIQEIILQLEDGRLFYIVFRGNEMCRLGVIGIGPEVHFQDVRYRYLCVLLFFCFFLFCFLFCLNIWTFNWFIMSVHLFVLVSK